MKDTHYFRPEWTCGRYNRDKHAAIFYNLIEGMSYFFEEESADVVGLILDAGRNGEVSTAQVSDCTGIDKEIISQFFEELVGLNLLTLEAPTPEGIKTYREGMARWKKANPAMLDKTTKEKLPFEVSNAEFAYTEKVGGVTNVMFELTYTCSEKCVHCYNFGASRPGSEDNRRGELGGLTLEHYKEIIDQLDNGGLYKVTISGGDPFSNPMAWDIIKYLYDKEIAFDILTNGLRIGAEADKLAGFYPRSVGISIYSSDPEVHDCITRVPGSWKKSMEVLTDLGNFAVPLNVKCCVMQPNFATYKGVADIARAVGAQPQFEISVTDSVEGDKFVSRNLRMTPEQYEVVLRDDNVPLYVGPEAPNYGGQKKDMADKGCGAGDNSFCIRPDGEVIPCCAFHLKLGNLKEKSMQEILDNPVLERWRNHSLNDTEECGTHDYCDYCNLCFGNSYSEHGDYKKASENCCYIAKIRKDLAHKIHVNLNKEITVGG